jgi:excisionase family DNA binding protein
MRRPETSPLADPPPLSRLYSVAQVAELMHCSKFHVYRLIAAGEFPALDIATPGAGMSKTRIRESDLLAYLDRAAL